MYDVCRVCQYVGGEVGNGMVCVKCESICVCGVYVVCMSVCDVCGKCVSERVCVCV